MIEGIEPSDAILQELALAMADFTYQVYTSDELHEIAEALVGADIGYIKDYISGSPGYTGDVYIVIWDGGPEQVTTFTRDKGGHLEVCIDAQTEAHKE